MMVGGGVDEELGPGESRPVEEWPSGTSNLQLTNKDGASSRLLFLTVQYVGQEAGASFNTGMESFPELEQRVVSPLEMGCTACYSPVYRPASPLIPPPVSPTSDFLNSTSPTRAQPASLPTLPEPGMIMLSDQCQFSGTDNYVVTTQGRIYPQNQVAANEGESKLLLLSANATHPTELVVAGGEACGDQRVEFLLSNGTIAYGIVESTDNTGASVIQIPEEYLVADRAGNTNLPEEVRNRLNESLPTENVRNENIQDGNTQDENGHLRALYNTLKEQGLIIEPGELRMETGLDQNQHLIDTSLLNETTLLEEDISPVFPLPKPQRRYWCEECDELLASSCKEHQVNRKISDKAVPSRARATLPASYLAINKVTDSNKEEYGVFARKTIPKRTQFGPIEGVIVKSDDIPSDDCPHLELTIETDTEDLKTLDVSNEHMSNWMRFVRMATPQNPPNILLSQLGSSLFFTTTNTIHPRQELLVWYSAAYATRRNLPRDPPPPEWPCATCGTKLKTCEEFTKHLNCGKAISKREENLTVDSLRRKNHALLSSVKNKASEKTKTVQSTTPYECSVCKKKFPRGFSLRRHILLLHTRENKYQCKVCQLGFSHSFNKLRHMRRYHPQHKDNKPPKNNIHRYESWTCSYCKLTFNSHSMLNLHTLVHAANNVEDNMMHIPEDIQDVFHKPEELVCCPQCSRKFTNKQKLANHVAEHGKSKDLEDKKFHCDLCGRNFISAIRYQVHSELHVDNNSKPLECPVCFKRLLTKSALSCHLKIHDCSVQWECPICKEHFGNVLLLKSHVHSHAVKGYYHCPHCEKVFDEYPGIRKHIRAFHSALKHSCQDCGKRFPTLDKLRMHLLRHSDHKEFLCDDCGKQFKRKDKLKEHMKRMHSGKKEGGNFIVPDQLPIADKKALTKIMVNSSSDYERYIYKCHSCLLGFKRRGMLVNHLANRHPDITPDSVPELNLPILKTTRDYYCQYCEKIYKSSSKRKAHILKNHPGLELPMSNRQKGGIPQIPGLPNPTFSQTVGSVTTNPHGCQWCHKQYASKAKLLQHQRKKHVNLLQNSEQMLQPLKNLDLTVNIEKGVKKRPKARTIKCSDIVEDEPVPIALSTNINHSITLSSTNLNHLQEYEIIITEDDTAPNTVMADDTSTIIKRSSYKNDNISSDLLSQAMSEIGVSLSDLRALSLEQYLKLFQSPSGQDSLYTPYTAR